MRDIVIVLMGLSLAFSGGWVWGWNAKGRGFERDKIALEAGVRLRTKKENDKLKEDIARALERVDVAEKAAEAADAQKRKVIDDMIKIGAPVAPQEIDVIDAMIAEAGR